MNDSLSPSDRQAVVELVREDKLLEAIKVYREKTGAGLKEAKQAIELLQAGQERPPVAASEAASESAVLDLFRTKGKIAAIKLYRDQRPGCGLKEAKEAVESLARKHGLQEPRGGCMALVAALFILGGGIWWLAH